MLVDGFEIGASIGAGGFGKVYIADDTKHGRKVAIKILNDAPDEAGQRRFDRERRAMGSLSGHPNIGVVHQSGLTDDERLYLVMEYLSGGSLSDRLADGPMTVREVLDVALALTDALSRAHDLGVLHLDLKPENILFSEFGTPKLVDFGISAFLNDQQMTTTVRATPAYASPEVLDGQPPAQSTDIYGLAVTMYSMLEGRAPYGSPDTGALSVIRAVAIEPVPTVDRPDVPVSLIRFLHRCMSKNPADRPKSMVEVAQELRAIADEFDDTTIQGANSADQTVAVSVGDDADSPHTRIQPGTDNKNENNLAGVDPEPAVVTSGNGSGNNRTAFFIAGGVLLAAILALVVVRAGGGDDPPLADPSTTVAGSETTSISSGSEPSTSLVATSTTTVVTSEIGPPTLDDLARATVQILLFSGDEVVCTGSGAMLDGDGTILTNSHVVTLAAPCAHDRIGIAITDNPDVVAQLTYDADVIIDDPVLDLAVLRISGDIPESLATVALGEADTLRLGDTIQVLGYPAIGGSTITVTQGSVSGFVSPVNAVDGGWIKSDAVISGGSSGGLAVDDEGLLVGIPTRVGTGSGPITDCRILTDTNGDGRTDQDDACVPVGGFINGIRPVNAAFEIIEQAQGASPLDRTPQTAVPTSGVTAANAFWSSDAVDFIAVDNIVLLQEGATSLCLFWEYQDFAPGSDFVVNVSIDGVVVPGFTSIGVNQGAVAGDFFACARSDEGLVSGIYEFIWSVETETVFTHAFIVGSTTGVTVFIENTTGSQLCVVQLGPTGASTLGLNRLPSPIQPGATFPVGIAAGTWNVRVLDCDGLLRADSTLPASEDLTVRVT